MSHRVQVGLKGRRVRWLAGVLLVVVLVLSAILVVVGAADRQQADDPRSSTPGGTGALGSLLAAEGIRISTTNDVGQTAADASPARTLVVANADKLDPAAARRLLAAGWGGVVLLRPTTPALARFGVPASGEAPGYGSLPPDCPVDAAQRAGSITATGARASYAATGPVDFACYPSGEGHLYLRAATADGVPVELVGGA